MSRRVVSIWLFLQLCGHSLWLFGASENPPNPCDRTSWRFGQLDDPRDLNLKYSDGAWDLVRKDLIRQGYDISVFDNPDLANFSNDSESMTVPIDIRPTLFQVEIAVDARTDKLAGALAWSYGEEDQTIHIEAIGIDPKIKRQQRAQLIVGMLDNMKHQVLPQTNLNHSMRRIRINLSDSDIEWMADLAAVGFVPSKEDYLRFEYQPIANRVKRPKPRGGAALAPSGPVVISNVKSQHAFPFHDQYFENSWPHSVLIDIAQLDYVNHWQSIDSSNKANGHMLAIEDFLGATVEIIDYAVKPGIDSQGVFDAFFHHIRAQFQNSGRIRQIAIVVHSKDFAMLKALGRNNFAYIHEVEDGGEVLYYFIADLDNN